MVIEEKKRSDIETKDKWNLEKVFSNSEDLENAYQKIDEYLHKMKQYQDHVMDNAKIFLEALTTYYELQRRLDKVVVYAHMKADEDTANTENQALKARADRLMTKVGEEIAFFSSEILEHSYDEILNFIDQEPSLKAYAFVLEDTFRFQKYHLPKSEEKLLVSFFDALDSSNQTASFLRDSDLSFGTILIEGEEIILNNETFSIYLKSKDRSIRKQVFVQLYQVYNQFKNTLSSTYLGEVKANTLIARLRGYKGAKEMFMYLHHIDSSVYDNLVACVHQHMDINYEYYQMKKQFLNLDEIHLYDVYVPLVENFDKTYSFQEAKDLVIQALSILGEDYLGHIKEAFTNRWIDIYPNKNKRGGAYSWGTYDTDPYILMNFDGDFHDVSTIAHELGHSMHSYYSHQNNDYHNSSYAIFVAEVASTVNELLLNYYMQEHTTDLEEKKFLLNQLLELFRTTIYRQTMFAEFEEKTYALYESGEQLTNQNLGDVYYELNKQYFGNDVVIDDEIRYEWERIPHFFMNFYVYQYATGLSAACYIVKRILNQEKGALEAYLNFLKTGGSMYPLEELKVAGVDMAKKEVIESALFMYQDTLNEFKKLNEVR